MLSSARPYSASFCKEADNPAAVRSLQRFRKALFVDHLKWDLRTDGQLESDQFDTSYAVHCIVKRGDELVGGFRAVATCHPYLAQTVFPHMASLRSFPRRPDIWEISRFGVAPDQNSPELSRLVYAVMLQFGYLRRAKGLVALVDLSHERLLRKLGIVTRRYGPPGIVGRDRTGRSISAVAGEIPLTEQSAQSLSKLMSIIEQVEIVDETLVLGYWAISA